MQDSLANWQWLVPLPSRMRAVVVGTGEEAARRPLTRGFERVDVVDPRTCRGDDAAFDAVWARMFVAGSLDCVAIPDVDHVLAAWPHPAHALTGIRKSLRPHDGHCVALEAVRPARGGVRWGRVARSPIVSGLRRAGFSRVHVYYVAQIGDFAAHLVPAHGRAVIAWDRAMEAGGVRSTVRRISYRAGLHAPSFAFRLVIASW